MEVNSISDASKHVTTYYWLFPWQLKNCVIFEHVPQEKPPLGNVLRILANNYLVWSGWNLLDPEKKPEFKLPQFPIPIIMLCYFLGQSSKPSFSSDEGLSF